MDVALVLEQLRGTSALVVGMVGPDGAPHAARAWGLVVTPAGDDLVARVILDRADGWRLDAATGPHRLATTCTEVRTLRSLQLKGAVVAVEEAAPADLAEVEAYKEGFFNAVLEIDNIDRALMDRMVPDAFVVATVHVEQAFDQTPGPHAGRPVERDGPAEEAQSST